MAKVKLRKPQRTQENDLDRRVNAVLNIISFRDDKQKAAFVRAVSRADAFAELTPSFQEIISAAEAARAENLGSNRRLEDHALTKEGA